MADTILDSVLTGQGATFTCMLSRQSGKNETSAIIEAYLLFAMESGTMVKAAPTFAPQVVNSRLRLLSMLDNDFTRDRVWRSYGYIIGLAPSPDLVKAQVGPRLFLFSAGPESHVVG